jgi:protein phosphatase
MSTHTVSDTLTLPGDPTLIVLAGVSGVGKSTWANRLFPETAVVASDRCRAMISDSEEDQSATGAAFSLLNTIVTERLVYGRTTVVDSTALKARDRRKLVALASDAGAPAMLVLLRGDMNLWRAGQKQRIADGGRHVPDEVLHRMTSPYEETVKRIEDGRVLSEEGFASAIALSRDEANAITRVQAPLSAIARREDIDVIGDVHGCLAELRELLHMLGYVDDGSGIPVHPDGRCAVFVGDLVDRGPDSLGVMRLVAAMVDAGSAIIGSLGNHDWKNWRLFVDDRDVQVGHGLDVTIAQVARENAHDEYAALCDRLFRNAPASSVFAHGDLTVVHGAVRPGDAGRPAGRGRRSPAAALAMYGQTDGRQESGLPNRVYEWAQEWEGGASGTVIFGHDVVGDTPRWINDSVIGIDTGCAFGGQLTAIRWPSREIVQVPATSVTRGNQTTTRT